jgi:DNA-binding phage protein
MIDSKTCLGKILILDTVKKFANLMDKTACSNFGGVLRQFVSGGGTAIMLAHVNKNRNEQGKVVFTGVADLVDDVDCSYTLDVVETQGDTRSIIFENIKNRGNVEDEAYYSYCCSTEIDYLKRLDSVRKIDEKVKGKIEQQRRLNFMLEKNKEAVNAIFDILSEGRMKKTELIAEVAKRSGISRKKINKALIEHRGDNISQHQFWTEEVGEHNTKTYHLNV